MGTSGSFGYRDDKNEEKEIIEILNKGLSDSKRMSCLALMISLLSLIVVCFSTCSNWQANSIHESLLNDQTELSTSIKELQTQRNALLDSLINIELKQSDSLTKLKVDPEKTKR